MSKFTKLMSHIKIRIVIFHLLNSSEDTKTSLSNSDQFLARPGSYRSAVSKLRGEILLEDPTLT